MAYVSKKKFPLLLLLEVKPKKLNVVVEPFRPLVQNRAAGWK